MRWRTAVGALTCRSNNEVSKRRLLELAMAAVLREFVGAMNMEHWHVEMSKRSIGGAYWSWRCQLGEGMRWRTAVGVLTLCRRMVS